MTQSDVRQSEIPLLDGRQRGLFCYSHWSDDVDDPTTPEFVAEQAVSHQCKNPRLWAVDVWGYEEVRKIEAGGDPQGFVPSAGLTHHFTRLKARVAFHSASGGTFRDFDIGHGIRLTLHTNHVEVRWLLPINCYKGDNPTKSDGTARQWGEGINLSTKLGAYIGPTDSSYGERACTNTFTYVVPANVADLEFVIPTGVKTLSAFQGPAGVPATLQWRLAPGGPGVGDLPIPANRVLRDTYIPQNAQVIASGPADPAARTITIVYRLEI